MPLKPWTKVALTLAVAVIGLLSLAGAARADTYVGRLVAEDLFDKLKFSGRIAVWPVDAAQAREAGLTPAAAATLGNNIRVAVHQIGAAKGLTFVERQAISKIFAEQQFAHNVKDSDFELLAQEANADALVLISLERESPADVVVSARLVKAKGPGIGQILAASKTYEVEMAEATATAPPRQAVAPQPNAPLAPPPTIQAPPPSSYYPGTVSPNTVTPTWGAATASAYGSYYAPAYAVAPAVTYVYPPRPAYYVRPYFAPRFNVGYAVAYGRWGWRR